MDSKEIAEADEALLETQDESLDIEAKAEEEETGEVPCA
jgi:hypothetical protein